MAESVFPTAHRPACMETATGVLTCHSPSENTHRDAVTSAASTPGKPSLLRGSCPSPGDRIKAELCLHLTQGALLRLAVSLSLQICRCPNKLLELCLGLSACHGVLESGPPCRDHLLSLLRFCFCILMLALEPFSLVMLSCDRSMTGPADARRNFLFEISRVPGC